MNYATLLIFVALGFDTFAVAIGLGLAGLAKTRWLRICLTFAFFEGVMPVVGLILGNNLSDKLGNLAEYVGALILIAVGVLELKEAFFKGDDDDDDELGEKIKRTQGWHLLLLGLSVSLDELAIGFSLGVLYTDLGPALIYIAIQAFTLTFLGLAIGKKLGQNLRERAELVAGFVLTFLGLLLLFGAITGYKLG